MLALSRKFDSVFDNFLSPSLYNLSTYSSYRSDYYRDNDDLILEVVIPKVKKEDVEVSIDRRVLTVSVEPKDNNSRLLSFNKKFTLSSDLSIDNIDSAEASLENGVLTITFKDVYKEREKNKVKVIPVK